MTRQAFLIPASLLALALAACGPSSDPGAEPAPAPGAAVPADAAAGTTRAEGIEIRDPWLRQPPPSAEVSAGYLRIENRGAGADRLVSVLLRCGGRGSVPESTTVRLGIPPRFLACGSGEMPRASTRYWHTARSSVRYDARES